MALLGTKKPLPKPGEVVTEPPPPKPGDDPPPSVDPPPTLPPDALATTPTAQAKVAMDGTVTKPPPQIAVVMQTDGGLNGQCWRAGTTVLMDPEAADFYLAKGYATRAP